MAGGGLVLVAASCFGIVMFEKKAIKQRSNFDIACF
jgi:hypothetical protein